MFDQIDMMANRYKGVPNMVIDVIGIETSGFGETQPVTRELPCFKLLRSGIINELKA